MWTMIKSGFECLYDEMKSHALREYPLEACGIVTANMEYLPMKNIAENPANDFMIDASELLKHDVKAIFHSHPDAPPIPSEADINGQIMTGVPWLLCSIQSGFVSTPYAWGCDMPVPELVGREFRHGPSGTDGRGDCYALIKDYYQIKKNITLPEFPRQDEWWTDNTKNLYLDHFKEAGFRELEPNETPQDDDVFLMKLMSPRVNHGGVLVENGQLILHHISGRLSRSEPLGRWVKFIDRWLRYAKTD